MKPWSTGPFSEEESRKIMQEFHPIMKKVVVETLKQFGFLEPCFRNDDTPFLRQVGNISRK